MIKEQSENSGGENQEGTKAILADFGQVASLDELEQLVFRFERALNRLGVEIQPGSELEAVCCSVIEVLGKHEKSIDRDPSEDVRVVFREVLGFWTFLKKIVRLQDHPLFETFLPHLELLNKGTLIQNTSIVACQEVTNKVFELLFALALLDVSENVLLDHPDLAKGDNPDILATIDGVCWGFACKTVYGQSGKTFFDNLKKGIEQIEAAPNAHIGIVVFNFRNLIDHGAFWPILNIEELQSGKVLEPVFAAVENVEAFAANQIWDSLIRKRDQVAQEIELPNVLNTFAGQKALPGFLAFAQTCAAKATPIGPIPTSIVTLSVGDFDDVSSHLPVFEKINRALHELL